MNNVTESKEKLLSICIPTFKREYLIPELLDSIYSQNIDHTLFEVCISDNSETDETKNVIEQKFSNIDNLKYKKSTCKGFLNSIEALKLGSGSFLKLHNDYSIFKPGAIQRIISLIEKEKENKSEIFFSLQALPNKKEISEFADYNSFLENINFYSTWSSSFTIWKSDFDRILTANIEPNYMYPHTTLLFNCTDKNKYIVDNYAYVENKDPKKKGGYNLIDNFVRIYLEMVKSDLLEKGVINKKTFFKVQNGIIKFCARWYSVVKHSENYTFSFENKEKIIRNECGKTALFKFYLFFLIYYPVHSVKKICGKNY
ncbi:MAG: glycosyltransferase family 2 protein [Treponema sp.]|nr:glycosyltransferase family 2 protein [Treponema sp.]